MGKKKNHSWLTTTTTYLLLLALLVGSVSSEEDDVKRSLVAFLEKLAPGNPQTSRDLGWNVSSDPCMGEWKGVACNNRTRAVRTIALEGLRLGGSIDAGLLCGRARSVSVVSLRNNGLTGIVPPEISGCSQLTHFYLSGNRLSGNVPPELALKNLKRLDLSNNRFSGELPRDLAEVSGLVTFLANDNMLSGSVPQFDFANLEEFNVSGNLLTGPLPQGVQRFGRDSVLGNLGLCGAPLEVACPPPPAQPAEPKEEKERKRKGEKAVVVYSGYIILCLVIVLFIAYTIATKRKAKKEEEVEEDGRGKKSSKSSSKKSSSTPKTSRSEYSLATSNEHSPAGATTSLVVLKNPVVSELRFETLLKAPAELLGRGRFGTLYKVVMPDGTEVAVKRIKDWTVSAQEFQRRMERLDEAKHPRVLRALAFYCSKQEKLVVYEYKPNGSLFKLLHANKEGNTFDWSSRLSMAAGIAEGMAFMHRDLRELGIGHGNLKSSNILLDANMDPCVSEYGLLSVPKQAVAAQSGGGSSSNGRKAVNPVNDSALQADTYGFGVILLELLTGKVVQSNGFDLAQWVNSVVREEWTVEVFDRSLMNEGVSEERLVRLLQVAFKCVDPSVNARPDMGQVAKMIDDLRREEEEETSSIVSESESKVL